jgi:hypothetical protein
MNIRVNRLADEIAWRFGDDSTEQVEGNAALILAAPELLAALKAGLHQMENRTGKHDLRQLFRAAIAKAEGGGE